MKAIKYICIMFCIASLTRCTTDNSEIKTSSKTEIEINSSALASDYREKAVAQFYRSEYDSSLFNLNISLKIFERDSSDVGIASIFNIIGAVQGSKGNNEQSLEYYLKSLKIYENLDDSANSANLYNNIGEFYRHQDDTEIALDYYEKAILIKERLAVKNPTNKVYQKSLSNTLNNIGIILAGTDKKEEALNYYFQSLEIKRRLEDDKGVSSSYTNIGNIYRRQDAFKEALEYYLLSLSIDRKIDDMEGIGIDLLNIGIVHMQEENFSIALNNFEKSVYIAKQIGNVKLLRETYSNIANIYETMGDIPTAYIYFKLYTEMKDTLLNKESIDKIAEMQTKYESVKKQKEIVILRTENQIKTEQSRRSQITLLGVGAILIIVIIFSLMLFSRFQVTKRQKKIIEEQKKLVDEKNKDITASIRYAERIQRANLPSKAEIDSLPFEIFVLFKPKAVVSGDFYWLAKKKGKIFLAASDCTGHGVPGALMCQTIIPHLNQTVNEKNIFNPSLILNEVRKGVINSLKLEGSEDEDDEQQKDGMDCVLMMFNIKNKILEWAAAYNPLYLFRDDELYLEVKGDKQPVGYADALDDFTNHSIDLKSGDCIYAFSDGYTDQFGGPRNKKFMPKRFKQLLLDIHHKTMEEQKKILDTTIVRWMDGVEQIDDILVMGIRIK
ncbi:hypothetical protein COB64_03645 [Candidatus Wolfebacteria bacterium]|nr:MAG: hypothetical protein COB64_03645 [Candidatus Wolfebacteria bacterium]